MAGTRLAMTLGTQRTGALGPDHGDMGFSGGGAATKKDQKR